MYRKYQLISGIKSTGSCLFKFDIMNWLPQLFWKVFTISLLIFFHCWDFIISDVFFTWTAFQFFHVMLSEVLSWPDICLEHKK